MIPTLGGGAGFAQVQGWPGLRETVSHNTGYLKSDGTEHGLSTHK